MRVGLIPPRGLEKTALATDFSLMLAQHKSSWTDDLIRTLRPSRYIVMDNGACEGDRVTNEELLDAASVFGADEIVLPDVMNDAAETLNLVDDFINEYVHTKTRKLMAVAQGLNLKQFQICINDFVDLEAISVIGLPRHMLGTLEDPVARLAVANWVNREFPGRFEIHFLGANVTFPQEIREVANIVPFVRSLDTSLPYTYTMLGVNFTDKEIPHPANIKRPSTYFTEDWSKQINHDRLNDNINTYLRWSYGE